MTEYDFSPEAFEAHIQKQQKISTWVDNTKRHPPANPFTPATPAVQALQIKREDDDRRHRRKESKDQYRDRKSPATPPGKLNSKHNRSASYSTTTLRPQEPPRPRTLPTPLQLPPHGYVHQHQHQHQQPSPTYYSYPVKFVSPRDSKHSSRTSSSTWLPPIHYPQQTAPHSAPVIPHILRSKTTPPTYGHPMQQQQQPHTAAYPNGSMPYLSSAPQFPHSYYQPKQPPLLKRIFNWGNNKQSHHQHHHSKAPRRKRSSSL